MFDLYLGDHDQDVWDDKDTIEKFNYPEISISNRVKISKVSVEKIERSISTKILRIYIHHKFYPSDEVGGSYFIVHIEGSILSEDLSKNASSFKFSQFFDKVQIHVDKKAPFSNPNLVYTWEREKHKGADLDGIKLKIFTDRMSLCRFTLFRRNVVSRRYRSIKFRYCEISPKLRQLLPNLRPDPSEDEVLLSVWQYITKNDLFGDKDHKIIKCDEVPFHSLLKDRPNLAAQGLKGLFQVDSFYVAYLRAKLTPHLLAEKPVLVEQYLDPQNTSSAE